MDADEAQERPVNADDTHANAAAAGGGIDAARALKNQEGTEEAASKEEQGKEEVPAGLESDSLESSV